MKHRGFFVVMFLVPLCVGLVVLGLGLAVPRAPQCPGYIVEYEDEERSGPMRPGETCNLYDYAANSSSGTRSYDQQRVAQSQHRVRLEQAGAVLTGYGAVGFLASLSGTDWAALTARVRGRSR
ncbi:hypothetical protein ACIQU5_26875 [Streptomyces sp. NPDC090306]|uniref:hypothetical protein n=1 Tax=unclassified Streptomyces TaxID=2593676 RepID=UPI0036ED14A1